jgi:hypothetical protein
VARQRSRRWDGDRGAIEKLAKRDRRTIAGWLKIIAEDAVASGGGTKKR